MMKNFKLITSLSKDTLKEKLEWRVTRKTDYSATFVSDYSMTAYKKLTFCVVSDQNSELEESNVLRVIFKVDKKYPPSSSTNPIKKIPINSYPSLINLIRTLSKKYLNRDYKYSGFMKTPEPTTSLYFNDITGLWEQSDDVEEGTNGYKPIPGELVMYKPENLQNSLKVKIISRKTVNRFVARYGIVSGESYELETVDGEKIEIFIKQRMKTPFSKIKEEKTGFSSKTKLIVPKDLAEYRKEVMNSIEDTLMEIPKNSKYLDKYLEVQELLRDMKYTNSHEEINILMFKCHKILNDTKGHKRKPPVIGDKWG
jgi:hypothetical protein